MWIRRTIFSPWLKLLLKNNEATKIFDGYYLITNLKTIYQDIKYCNRFLMINIKIKMKVCIQVSQ